MTDLAPVHASIAVWPAVAACAASDQPSAAWPRSVTASRCLKGWNCIRSYPARAHGRISNWQGSVSGHSEHYATHHWPKVGFGSNCDLAGWATPPHPHFRRFFESGLTANYIGRLGRGFKNLWAVMAGTNTKFIVPPWRVAARGPHVQASFRGLPAFVPATVDTVRRTSPTPATTILQ
jgi:hypothetical protein